MRDYVKLIIKNEIFFLNGNNFSTKGRNDDDVMAFGTYEILFDN